MSGKLRICPQCRAREVEKYCTYCSECAQINKDLSNEIHNYNQRASGYKSAYMREYYRRKRDEKIRISEN